MPISILSNLSKFASLKKIKAFFSMIKNKTDQTIKSLRGPSEDMIIYNRKKQRHPENAVW